MNQVIRVRLCFTDWSRLRSAITDSGDNAEDEFGEDFDTAGIVMEDLAWRVEKLRLEEQNIKRFLKAKPVFLPYEECRKWVQAFGRWRTEEDWLEWIAMGEKRNSYIPVSGQFTDRLFDHIVDVF